MDQNILFSNQRRSNQNANNTSSSSSPFPAPPSSETYSDTITFRDYSSNSSLAGFDTETDTGIGSHAHGNGNGNDDIAQLDDFISDSEQQVSDFNNTSGGEITDDDDLTDTEGRVAIALPPPPPHSCAYCGIHNASCVVKCDDCNKWFCNMKSGTSGKSHIIQHLILSRHNRVVSHEESDLGETQLECYNCGGKNIFLLGFMSAKQQNTMVILCRLPCAQVKDPSWDSSEWQALIDNNQLLSWVAKVPTEEDQIYAKHISPKDIVALEAKWRTNKDFTADDLHNSNNGTGSADHDYQGGVGPELEQEITPIMMRYNDPFEYQRSFAPLVKVEADYDKAMKESQSLERISVTWGIGLNRRHTVKFALSAFESGGMKIAVGDEIILHYAEPNSIPWQSNGYIIRLPNATEETFVAELVPQRKGAAAPPPTHLTFGFTAEFVWKGVSYDRMQEALKTFALNKESVSEHIFHKLLGHDVPEIEFDVKLPSNLDVPGFIKLNKSQANAVKTVLKRPLSLIQGPPGTGKTVTSATIVYHLSKMHKEQILVCASSNIAVDHLTLKLAAMGLNVVRLFAKSRDDVESMAKPLSLSEKILGKAKNGGRLNKLYRLKQEVGELSSKDMNEYLKLLRKEEKLNLQDADVICTTCVGAADTRLKKLKFKSVLIDESTQAVEPESLIPIVKGSKQVILVGDHQQLGPVILDKKAADCGLKQSFFERLIVLGHVPIRLEVQYRMNPYLSEFPSNMFYEGSLQNGVTSEQRTLMNSKFPWPIQNVPMMFWANYGREEISASGTSYLNRMEAGNCDKAVCAFIKDGIKPEQIGVITPYEGQRTYIAQYFQLNGALQDKSLYTEIEVASVDAFQGREKDIIIFSCVRANDKQFIGFLSDPRRLNVAITRAKYGFIILGNPRALCKNALWNHLLTHFREKGCLVEGTLDNLTFATVPLRRVNHNINYNSIRNVDAASSIAGSSYGGGGATDTASMVSSYAPRSVTSSTARAFPPFMSQQQPMQWPILAASAQASDDAEFDTENATMEFGKTEDEEYYGGKTTRKIDSSFSSKLSQINAANGGNSGLDRQKKIDTDIRSITSSFASQLGLR